MLFNIIFWQECRKLLEFSSSPYLYKIITNIIYKYISIAVQFVHGEFCGLLSNHDLELFCSVVVVVVKTVKQIAALNWGQ